MTAPGKTLMILDDEKSYVDLLAQLLTENLTCPVATFIRPLEALEALPSLDVGFIVTDYFMPQLNGLEFILRARRVRPALPFVIITGHAAHFRAEDYQHITELRAVLHKPVKWQTLAETIQEYWIGPDAPVMRSSLPCS